MARSRKRLAHRQRHCPTAQPDAPNDSAYFEQRYSAFEQKLKQADQQWQAQMKPYAGRKSSPITAPGRTSPNTCLNVVGYVDRVRHSAEPQHTVELIGQISATCQVICVSLIRSEEPNAVARDTGGKVVVLMPSVGGEKEITIISSCSLRYCKTKASFRRNKITPRSPPNEILVFSACAVCRKPHPHGIHAYLACTSSNVALSR